MIFIWDTCYNPCCHKIKLFIINNQRIKLRLQNYLKEEKSFHQWEWRSWQSASQRAMRGTQVSLKNTPVGLNSTQVSLSGSPFSLMVSIYVGGCLYLACLACMARTLATLWECPTFSPRFSLSGSFSLISYTHYETHTTVSSLKFQIKRHKFNKQLKQEKKNLIFQQPRSGVSPL